MGKEIGIELYAVYLHVPPGPQCHPRGGPRLAPGAPLLAIQYSQARRRNLEQVFSEVTATGERRNWPPAVLFCCRGPKAGAAA